MAMHFEALKMLFLRGFRKQKERLNSKIQPFDFQKEVGEVGRAVTYLRALLPGDS